MASKLHCLQYDMEGMPLYTNYLLVLPTLQQKHVECTITRKRLHAPPYDYNCITVYPNRGAITLDHEKFGLSQVEKEANLEEVIVYK